MNWKHLLPRLSRNARNAALENALETVLNGRVDSQRLDDEALAIVVFALADKIHKKDPNIAGRYGWARLLEVQAFTDALFRTQAQPPQEGLK